MRRDVSREELIGRSIEVVESGNPTLKGLKGLVVDETKNTLVVRSTDKERVLLKAEIRFAVTIGHERFTVDGSQLLRRPEKRME
jgi:ribonuclease P protein subunit POP4